jgi:hypothetical protein
VTSPRTTTSSNAEQAWDRILGYVKVMAPEHPEMERRFKEWSRSGFPGSTMGGFGGGPSIIADGERVPVTGVELAAVFSSDQIADMHQRYNATLHETLGHLVQLWAIRHDILEGGKEAQKAKKRQNTLTDCANAHGCPDEAWGWKAGRCGTCYQYRRRTGRDRTGRETEDVA